MSPSPRPHARRAPLLGAVIGAVVLLLVPAPAPVVAHADLVSSTPEPNASLLESPSELRLSFSEPIDPELAHVDLLDASQSRVSGLGPLVVSEGETAIGLDLPELEAGTYTVTYQVVSAVDGHATTGIFAFVVDPTGTEAPPSVPPGSTSPSVDGWTIAGRWAGLGGALVAFGSLLMWWRSRPLLGGGPSAAPPWGLVAAASAIAFVGLAAYLSLAARPIVAALPERAGAWPLDFAAPFGATPFAMAMRLALAGCAAAAILGLVGWAARRRRPGLGAPLAALAGCALVACLAGMSLAAHAAAAGGPAFAVVDWGHLVAVGAWLGGLPAVAVLARRPSVDRASGGARAILRRHGGVALVAAPVVALTGIANSPLVLGDARELVGSGYGNLLLAKAGLLSVAVGIGAVNFLVLRGRGRASVATLVAVELAVATLAVGIAATMVTVQPAAARGPTPTAAPVTPAHLFGTAGPARVHATINLPTPGRQAYQVTVTDPGGLPLDDLQLVFLDLAPPPGTTPAPERVELAPDPARPGLHTASGAYLSVEGTWTVEVVVRRAGALDEAVAFEVPVRQPSPARLVPPPDTGVGVPAPIGLLWIVLPAGAAGWLPAITALAGLVAIGAVARRRASTAAGLARGALLAVLAIAVLGAASRALVATANAPSEAALAEHAPPAEPAGSLEDGAALYRANCASCHGTDGLGDGPVRTLPPAGPLPEVVRRMTSAELSYRIANGYAGTPMPAFAATLTEGERWTLVTYLEDRWR